MQCQIKTCKYHKIYIQTSLYETMSVVWVIDVIVMFFFYIDYVSSSLMTQ